MPLLRIDTSGTQKQALEEAIEAELAKKQPNVFPEGTTMHRIQQRSNQVHALMRFLLRSASPDQESLYLDVPSEPSGTDSEVQIFLRIQQWVAGKFPKAQVHRHIPY